MENIKEIKDLERSVLQSKLFGTETMQKGHSLLHNTVLYVEAFYGKTANEHARAYSDLSRIFGEVAKEIENNNTAERCAQRAIYYERLVTLVKVLSTPDEKRCLIDLYDSVVYIRATHQYNLHHGNSVKVLNADTTYFQSDINYLEGFLRERGLGETIAHLRKLYPH